MPGRRWDKESKEFVDALVDGVGNPLSGRKPQRKPSPSRDPEKELALRIRQTASGGRPAGGPAADPLVPYNIKLRKSELEAVRELAYRETRTIRELLSEAVADLLRKYQDKEDRP